MTYNRQGIIYLMNLLSLPFSKYYLPKEIRMIIWNYCHTKIITCIICSKMLINFNINFLRVNNENFSIINGNAKCKKCNLDLKDWK